jgi:hypothetical protein
MRDAPQTEQLLKAVLDLLRTEILESVPRKNRAALLMCNRAIDIAIARLHTGQRELRSEGARLQSLLGADGDKRAIDEGLVTDYNRRLVEMIRAGAFDTPSALRSALHRHLVETLAANIRETNPKMLGDDVET